MATFGDSSIVGNFWVADDATINGLTVGKGNGSLFTNTAVGVSVLASTTGNDNVGVGYLAMNANTTGFDNTAIGRTALYANTTGYYNIGIGTSSGRFLSDGTTANTESIRGIYIGPFTKSGAASSINEIAIGYETIGNGTNTVTIGNTSVTANYFNGAISSTGDATINGVSVGKSSSSGNSNTRLGASTMASATTGGSNTAIGASALAASTTGSYNTAVGSGCLISTEITNFQSGIGYYCLANITSGGGNNVGAGFSAGRYYSTGTASLTNASNCTFIGASSRASANGVSNETVIGYNAVGNGTNTVTIGNSSVTNNYFTGAINATGGANLATTSGNVGIGTTTPSEKLEIRTAPSASANSVTALMVRSTGANNGYGDYAQLGATGYFGSKYSSSLWNTSIVSGTGNPILFSLGALGSESEVARIDSGGFDVTGAITATTGITVATGQTNLANYLEGTYTPTISASTSGTITLNTSSDTLSYTRIGNVVHVRGQIQVLSVSSPVGNLNISLPFTNANLPEFSDRSAGALIVSNSVSKTANDFILTVLGGTSYASVARVDDVIFNFDSANEMKSGTVLLFNLTYPV